MKSKTEQKPATKAGEAKESDIDIQEIGMDDACEATGGLVQGCAGCGGGCSVAPEPPIG